MVRSRKLVGTILAGLMLMAVASQSQARNLGAIQVNIETRFVAVTDTFLRDIGVDFDHQIEQSTFGEVDYDYIVAEIFGEFDAQFRKRYKGTSRVRVICGNGQNLQSGRQNFKSQKGANKHRFQKNVLMIPIFNCPFPVLIQIEIDLKGGALEQFVQRPGEGDLEAVIRARLLPTDQ